MLKFKAIVPIFVILACTTAKAHANSIESREFVKNKNLCARQAHGEFDIATGACLCAPPRGIARKHPFLRDDVYRAINLK